MTPADESGGQNACLNQRHAEFLEVRAVLAEIARERGYRSVTRKAETGLSE